MVGRKIGRWLSKRRRLAAGVLAGTSVLGAGSALGADANQPNFIFILVDDLGWTDIACASDGNDYDSSYYQTPNIASLRADGMRFTNAYAAFPLCKPTRASIMTGKYPRRAGFKEMDIYSKLPLCETTIPEALDAGGVDYVSASVGKWNLSAVCFPDVYQYYPERQGFDYNYGGTYLPTPPSPERHFEYGDGVEGWDGDNYPGLGDPNENEPNEYLADSLTTRAIEFMQSTVDGNSTNYGKPYFLYLSHYSIHTPIQAKQSDINDVNENWTPDPCDPPDGDSNEVYAAMIKNLDDNVGRILDNVVEPNNTVIVFFSDNGATTDYTSNLPLRGKKGTLYEGGIRVPMIVKWPGVTDANSTCDTPVSSIDFFPTMLEMAYPSAFDANDYPAIDGVSLVPLLEDANGTGWSRDELYWAKGKKGTAQPQPLQRAIRKGDYKLIFKNPDYELYNLADDIGENNNLYPVDPNDPNDPNAVKFNELKELLENWYDSFKPYKSDPNIRYSSIQAALDDTNDSNAIILPAATFKEDIAVNGNNITITLEDPNDPAIIAATIIESLYDGGPVSTITIAADSNNFCLIGVTITSGNGRPGIEGNGVTATIDKCVIRDNFLYWMGDNGGGIHNLNGMISNCTIMSNYASGYGGGISDCNGVIRNCIIANNSANVNGGGLYNCNGTISNCTIVSNDASNGGGLSGCSGAAITNCVIWGNEPNQLYDSNTPNYSCIEDWTGGGTDNISSDPCFIHFYDFFDETTADADVNSFDTIKVTDASLYEVNDVIEYDNDGMSRTVVSVDTTNDIVTFEPQRAFESEEYIIIHNWGSGVADVGENHHLIPVSLCINAGDPNGDYSSQTDIDGQERVARGRVDIGGDEVDWLLSVRNGADEPVVLFDDTGNLFLLGGDLEEDSSHTATGNDEFRFQDSSSTDVAIIDANDGNMYIAESLYENKGVLAPGAGSDDFVIQNSDGDVIAYIDESGNLYLQGALYEY